MCSRIMDADSSYISGFLHGVHQTPIAPQCDSNVTNINYLPSEDVLNISNRVFQYNPIENAEPQTYQNNIIIKINKFNTNLQCI